MFDSDMTINLGDGADIHLAPCDLLHLFNFVREEGNTQVATSTDWKFRKPPAPVEEVKKEEEEDVYERRTDADGSERNGFKEAEFVLTGAVALRQITSQTIGVEVEKRHFLAMTGAKVMSLPEYHH